MEKKYFYGKEISSEGIKYGYVDYACLRDAIGGAILNNTIVSATANIGYWDCVNGSEYNEETEEYKEVYQYFIIGEYGARILSDETNEIIYRNEELDLYVWGVTHYGTSWDYVLTDIAIEW